MPEDPLVIEPEAESSKSSWTPSFQVVEIGRGITPSDDQSEAQETPVPFVTTTAADSTEEHSALDAAPLTEEADQDTSIDQAGVETPKVGQELASPINSSEDVFQLRLDTSSLDTSDEPARPWTPSYSVHSQGSPLRTNVDLEEEKPEERPWTPSYSVHSQGSPLPVHADLPEDNSTPSEKCDIPEQETNVTTDTPDEKSLTNLPVPQETHLEHQNHSEVVAEQPVSEPPFHEEVDVDVATVLETPEHLDTDIEAIAQVTEDERTSTQEDLAVDTLTSETVPPIPHLVDEDVEEVRNCIHVVTSCY